jgi:hypothetical protein
MAAVRKPRWRAGWGEGRGATTNNNNEHQNKNKHTLGSQRMVLWPRAPSRSMLHLYLSLFAAHCSLESLNLHLVLLVPSVLLYSATMLTRSISFSVFCLSITKIYSSTTETVCGGAQFAKVDKRQERERERAVEQQSSRAGGEERWKRYKSTTNRYKTGVARFNRILIKINAVNLEPCGTIARLLLENLKVLVDDRNSQQNSGSRTNGAHEVSHHRESSDAESTKGSCSRNVAVELLDH